MASRLGVYNEALRLLGERRLASLSEDREARRLLDSAWDANAHDSWLEEASWNFALRAVKIGYDSGWDAEWGQSYAFEQPSDMVRMTGIYIDEYMRVPLRDYLDEKGYWITDMVTELYVQYVSNDASYGGDLGLWPASFAKYVSAFLAREIAPNLKNDVDLKSIDEEYKRRERDAKSKDGLKNPSKRFPTGSWVNSRATLRENR